MYIFEIKRPKQALEDYHPKGTTVTIELDYHECILIDHALHEYEKAKPEMTRDDKYFEWQFSFLRDVLKNGIIDGFWSDIFYEKFRKKNEGEMTDEKSGGETK